MRPMPGRVARPLAASIAMLLAAVPAWAEAEVMVGAEAREDLVLTVYMADLALVQDRRSVEIEGGGTRLAFEDVSARLRPETAVLTGEGLVVLEQTFDGRVIDQRRLLEAYEGETVELVRTHPTTGEETREHARIVSVHDGVVLEVDGRIETGVPGRLAFPAIPPGLRTRPTLTARVESERGGPTPMELTYLSHGLRWQTDYVATLSEDETTLTLAAWATVTNVSGTDYPDARLRLVAGDINLTDGGSPRLYKALDLARAEAAAPPPEPEPAGDYHVYDYPRRVTLHDDEVRQLALIRAHGVAFDKEYRTAGRRQPYTNPTGDPRPEPVTVRLSFDNEADVGLGEPLPGGVVRVHRGGEAGLFLGEDRLPDTPVGGEVQVTVGRAFDVRAERRQTDFMRVNQPRDSFESAHEITLSNAREEAVTVTVAEAIPGDWEMLEESHPHEQAAANRAEWRIVVPAESDAVLTYRVRVRM